MNRLLRYAMLGATSVLILVLSACSSTPVQQTERRSRNIPPAYMDSDVPSSLTQDQANDVSVHAISLVGTPYRWGGNTPETGFDCSGLIAFVYKNGAAITPPRTVAALVNWGQAIPRAALRAGDLVVFTQKGVSNHAGIYVGEGRFVHAPSTGGAVRLDALSSGYWSRQVASYRRP